MRRSVLFLTLTATLLFATPALSFETPPDRNAATYLGPLAEGPGYRVEPVVKSDGFMRTFIFDTSSYGRSAVVSVTWAKQRANELHALSRLEQMSKSDTFAKSLGNSALAPVRFGANLLTKPGETINNTVSGIGNMFDRIGAGVSERKASRDSVPDSLTGVAAARRQLAVELGVDPYTDFQPLAHKLEEIARAAALGGLSVKAALMAVPGAVGIAVSSTSTAGGLGDTLREKTPSQIAQQVKASLLKLHVPAKTSAELIDNRNYTPADLLIIDDALTRLKAANTELFVSRAARAQTRDVAIFHRSRAHLLAAKSAELGGLTEFVMIADFALNRRRDGTIVAAFPLDDVAWTETESRAMTAITGSLRAAGNKKAPVVATSAAITPMARAEITKLGWKIVALKN